MPASCSILVKARTEQSLPGSSPCGITGFLFYYIYYTVDRLVYGQESYLRRRSYQALVMLDNDITTISLFTCSLTTRFTLNSVTRILI